MSNIQDLGNGNYYNKKDNKSYIKANVTAERLAQLEAKASTDFEKELIALLIQANLKIEEIRVVEGCAGIFIPELDTGNFK